MAAYGTKQWPAAVGNIEQGDAKRGDESVCRSVCQRIVDASTLRPRREGFSETQAKRTLDNPLLTSAWPARIRRTIRDLVSRTEECLILDPEATRTQLIH